MQVYHVDWKPTRNSERTALKVQPGPWLVEAESEGTVIRGQRCWYIWPQGKRELGRWVHADKVNLIGDPFDV